MSVRTAPLDLPTLETLPVEAYAIFVGADERPLWGLGGLVDWQLGAGLSRLLEAGMLAGADGESLLTTTGGRLPGARVFVFGLGAGEASAERFAAVARRSAESLEKAGVESIAIGLPEFPAPAASKAALEQVYAARRIDVVLLQG